MSKSVMPIPCELQTRIVLASPACLHIFFPRSLLVPPQVTRQCRVSVLLIARCFCRCSPLSSSVIMPIPISKIESWNNIVFTQSSFQFVASVSNTIVRCRQDSVPFCMKAVLHGFTSIRVSLVAVLLPCA